jgi:trehalose 6-phosphate phosphatase
VERFDMIYLFSDEGLRALRSLSLKETLFAFDFDGTLSKISSDRDGSSAASKTSGLLERLAKHATTAVISGRSVADLKQRLGFEASYLIGNHGIESNNVRAQTLMLQARKTCSEWKSQLGLVLAPGCTLEDKEFSLAIHYRESEDKTGAFRAVHQTIESLNPRPRIVRGKSVVNLLLEGAPHKGDALKDLMETTQLKSALYIGDDETDEDVFKTCGDSVMTVRVGHKRSSSARYFIERQSQINLLLEEILVSTAGRVEPTTRPDVERGQDS